MDRTAIVRGLGGHVPAERIGEALAALAADGLAASRSVPTGGRPREEWRGLRDVRENEDTKKAPTDGQPGDSSAFFVSSHDDDTAGREVWVV